MSQSSSSSIKPKITKDGKFMCEDDGMTYNTREEFDQHCMDAHRRSPSRTW